MEQETKNTMTQEVPEEELVAQAGITSDASTEALLKMATELTETATTKPTFKEKLKSRKFWVSIAGIVVGICGLVGCNNNIAALIAFSIIEIVSILAYCISEGVIDSKRTDGLLAAVQKLVDMIGQVKNGEDVPMPDLTEVETEVDITGNEFSKNANEVEGLD